MWTYVIQTGENLDLLAKIFKTRVTALEAANPGIRLKPVIPGQAVNIPGLPSVSKYEVKSGDNLDSIGDKFRTNAATIRRLNLSILATQFAAGQTINVPGDLDRGQYGGSNIHDFMPEDGRATSSFASSSTTLEVGQVMDAPRNSHPLTSKHIIGKTRQSTVSTH